MFTTWVDGERTNHVKRTLPYDPSADFHDYRIGWAADRVTFEVDGEVFATFETGIPRRPMYLMSNAFWPHWLEGPTPLEAVALEIEHLAF